MNVNKQMFEKNNKENIFTNAASSKLPTNKNRTNIGEEIRKKLKINTPTSNSLSVLMPNNTNVDTRNIRNQESFQIFTRAGRENIMQRSVDLGRDTSRSVKSVRFEQKGDEKKLSRKHSTSSILKNNKVTRKQRPSQKLSLNNSICSNIQKQDQSTQNSILNKNYKQKYQKICSQLQLSCKKYRDQMFPLITSSIARSSNRQQKYKQLKWVRLGELYDNKYLTIWDNCQKNSIKIEEGQYSKSSMTAICYNSIKYNNFLLEKIFECQGYNQYGIYFLKINVNGTWKYVIIDDYVPVYYSNNKAYPAFLKVTNSNPLHLQLWPYLLQKAYAKYYSNYECLDTGNTIDLLQQLTGCYPQPLTTSNPQHLQQILHEITNYDSILLAQDRFHNFHPIIPHKTPLTTQTPCQSFLPTMHSLPQFIQKFQKVYCIVLHKYFYSGYCTIKYSNHNVKQKQNINRNNVSIRSVKIQQSTQCVFSLSQKDQKYYYLGEYRYVWVRIVVAMREAERSYRWVAGQYANRKYANLQLWLEPAEYIVLIIPQWKNNIGFDLNLTFQGNIKSSIQRKPYITNQDILIQAAMDLAQSKGKLKQLNQNICTYSYIDRKLGLIIQNINNERANGFVRILRSIQGLQKSGQSLIRAYNKQFACNNTIEVRIQSLQHFTVVLAVQGGVKPAFLDQFDFGS